MTDNLEPMTVETLLRQVRDAGAEDDNHGAEDWTHSDKVIDTATTQINALILKARIDEVNYLNDNYQENSQDWEREHPGYSTAMIPMEDYINRRTVLQSQLEQLLQKGDSNE